MSQWKVYPDHNYYFVTTTIVEAQKVFTSDVYCDILIASLKYCIAHKGLHLHGYVIMPNHAHYILSNDDGGNLSNIMRDYKTHASRKITQQLLQDKKQQVLNIFRHHARIDNRGNNFKVWEEGFHPIVLRDGKFIKQKLSYIHENPIRKNYVADTEDWKYSSARNYYSNDHTVIEVECI
jgi:REP element-mobilizing transposase RayT